MFPEISSSVAITLSLKVAAPAALMSSVRAVMVLPPSLPLIIRSLSCTAVAITKSELPFFVIVHIVVASTLKWKSAPPESNTMSEEASRVMPVPSTSKVPSAVICMFASVPAASTVTREKAPLVAAVMVTVSLELGVITIESSVITVDPTVKSVVASTVPANVTLAPLKVAAVVPDELDLISSSPLLLFSVPKSVPSSLRNISAPPASRIISVPASSSMPPASDRSSIEPVPVP